MKPILSERNIVVILFVMVLVTFAFAQEDSKKKIPQIYSGMVSQPAPRILVLVKDKINEPGLSPDISQ
ncbi:MAG: hypothetical protein ACO25B_13080 [Chitinophagaceae bacterium]